MKRITINGKEYPCRVTMGAMLRFKQETGRDVIQLNANEVADLVTLLWCCIASASKVEGVEFGMELMDFADMLEPETIADFFTSMEEGKGDPEKKTGQPTS